MYPVKKCKMYKKLGCAHVDGSLYDFYNCPLSNEFNIKHSKNNDINELNIIDLVLFLIWFLGLFTLLGYGLYFLFGWIGSSILIIALLITLGGCFICTD